MPQAHRVGDKALNPADAHGCPACPHPVQGPALSGSPDVFVNGRPQMRVGDPGMHAACCGPNTWQVAQGSRTVFVNGIPPSRVGDATTHCGGSGQVIEGSPNVIIGDATETAGPLPPEPPPPKPVLVEAWPAAAKFFVNLAADEASKHGRKVTVYARVDPPQGGVPVYFSLPEVQGNATEDLEAGSEAKMVTQQATTDGSGVARAEMELSSNAGDLHQARASLEPDGSGDVADTGLQAVWRKLSFDVIEMQKPPEGFFSQLFPKRYSLDNDLKRAVEGFKRVFIDFEDSGKRHSGEFRALLRVEEALEWCKAACPPGPSPGKEPRIHLAVVPALVLTSLDTRRPSYVRPGAVVGKHTGGGTYTFDLPKAPYIKPDGTILDNPEPILWIRNPTSDASGWPNSIDEPESRDYPYGYIYVAPKGELGTKQVTADLSKLPARLKPGGAFPPEVELIGYEYAAVQELAGICLEGGQYVIVSESLDGEVIMHEVGHALGLAAPADTNDGINHCKLTSCVMFFADEPSQVNDFHGGPTPSKGSCAHWIRRLNMTKEHLYQRWWTDGKWPEQMTEADADPCPCTGH